MTILSYFAKRLKEERERIGFTQEELGQSGGVSARAQQRYEKEGGKPDIAYLANISKVGIDVLYVVTGQRKGDPELKPEEAAILKNYRNAPEEGKRAIEATSAALAKR